jgi:AsmA family protein
MHTSLKWLFSVLAGALVLLLVTGSLVLIHYDYNGLRPRIAEAVKQATGRNLVIGGDLRLEPGLSPSIVAEDVRLGNAPWGSRPDMATVSRLELKLSLPSLLAGKVAITRLVLIEPDLLIETDPSGVSNLVFDTAVPRGAREVEESDGDLTLERFVLQNGTLTLRDGRTKTSRILAIRTLVARGTGDEPLEVELDAEYDQVVLNARGSIGPLNAFLDRETPLRVNMTMSMQGAEISIQGSVADPVRLPTGGKTGLDLAIDAGSPDLSMLSKTLGVELPFSSVRGPVSLRGVLSDPQDRTFRLSELELHGAGSLVKGNLEVSLAGLRPSLKGELSSPRLDLTAVFPKRQRSPAGRSEGQGRKVIPDDRLPLERLSALDAELDIEAGEILFPHAAVTQFRSEIRLEDGLLKLPLQGKMGGGSLVSTLRVDTRQPKTEAWLLLSLDKGRLGQMLELMGRSTTLDGIVDLEIDVAGQGGSMAELMSTMDGSTLLVLGRGQVENKHMDLLGKGLGSTFVRLLNPDSGARETTIDCLVNQFVISQGIARCTALVVDTPEMIVSGKGEINLSTEAIDILFDPKPKGVGVQGIGTLSLSMSELAKPLKLSGTLAEPSLGVDLGRTAWTIGKAAGGVALFGPVGILGALTGGNFGNQENPCLAAFEQIEQEREAFKEKRKGVVDRVRGIFR